MMNKIVDTFRLQPQEQPLFMWVLLHAFAMGISFVILLNIPMAIFLTKFGGEALPYAFIANAAIGLSLGALYGVVEKRVQFSSLQIGLLSLIIMLTFFVWVIISSSNAKWIVAGSFITCCMLFEYIQLEFWSVLNRVFTLQQAKRFFGIFGGASSISGICTGFSIPILIRWVGTNQLLLIASLTGCVSLFSLIKIRQVAREKIDFVANDQETNDETQSSSNLSFKSAFKNKYFRMIFLTAAISTCSGSCLYILFNTLAHQRFTDTATLAEFFGLFYALTDVLQLICNTLVLKKFLKSFGVIVTIVTQPLIILIIGIFTIMTSLIPPVAVYAFWMVAMMQMFFSFYGWGVRAPAFLVLYQPLKARSRSFIQSKVALIINPLSRCLISVLLLVVSKTVGISLLPVVTFLLALNALGVFFTLLLKSGYLSALRNALTKIYLIQPQTNMVDKNLLPLLQQKLSSPFPEEIIFSLRSLEEISPDDYKRALAFCFDATDPIIRRYVILQVEKYTDSGFFEKIRFSAKNDSSLLVRSTAYQALTRSSEKKDIELALSGLDDPELSIRECTVLGVFLNVPTHYYQALKQLLTMQNSEEIEQRKAAARIIGKSMRLDLSKHLIRLFEDKNLNVRKAAIIAAGEIGNNDVLCAAIRSENSAIIPQSIIEAVVNSPSPIAVNSIELRSLSPEAQQLLINACGYLQSAESISYLLSHLDTKNNIKLHKVLMALMQRNYQSVDSSTSIIESLIDEEIALIKRYKMHMAMIPKNTTTDALYGLFKRFLWLEQESLLALLSFIYGQKDIFEIRSALENTNEEQSGYAIELLDRQLLPKHKDRVINSIEPCIQSVSTDGRLFNQLLSEILDYTLKPYNLWISAAAIYYVGDQGKIALKEKLMMYKEDSDELIKETLDWTLNQLSRGSLSKKEFD
ncbi:MAG: HEAT repeat domain-containing protein [Legionellaceae bacterium]|nr:HEAT repeat domain-containing protein [Legionellaceae bacterium]